MTETSVDDILWSGAAKSASWAAVGAWIGGPITSRPQKYHAKEYVKGQPGGGKPKYYPSGDPVRGRRIPMQTRIRESATDDGIRTMYLEKPRQITALRQALLSAGVRTLEPGGELWVQWTGEEDDAEAGANAAKTWTARYRPPAGAMPDPVEEVVHAPDPPAPVPMTQPAYAPRAYEAVTYSAAPRPPEEPPGLPAMVPSAPPQMPPAQAAATPPVPAGRVTNTITASVAAALRAQGVDTSGFTITDG